MSIPSVLRSRKKLAVLAGVVVLLAIGLVWWTRTQPLTIGVEGRRLLEMVGPRLYAAPFTPGDAVSVRIAGVEPTADGFRYDLRYIAYGPGRNDLSDHLFYAGNVQPDGLPELAITVDSILPRDHKGELFATEASAINLHSHYTTIMGLSWCLWGLLIVPLLIFGRPRRVHRPAPPRTPTTSERLKDLLEQAARGRLSAEQQADLERLLLAFWSHQLNLPDERLGVTLAQLKQHPTAGSQIAKVEAWLHRRDAAGDEPARELLSEVSQISDRGTRR